jgi:ribosomal protein L37AE/L43A
MSTDFSPNIFNNSSKNNYNDICSNMINEYKHKSAPTAKNQQQSTDFSPKLLSNFNCELCNYVCSKESDILKHYSTRKHKNQQMSPKLSKNINNYQCNYCKKSYKERTGLWRHNKICSMIIPTPIYATNEQKQQVFTDEMVMELIKQNKELQTLLLEQQKMVMEQSNKICSIIHTPTNNSHNNISNNINTNSNNTNNTFNLQVFLNETCKNAMNLTDFVNSLNVTIADLEETGRLGFSDGITKIIVKGLKDLDITERPIHCTDVKRETIYVKEEDVWQKDDNHEKLTKAIKQVSHKNTKNIMEWQRLNPEYSDSNSKQSSRFNKLLLNVMSGGTIEEQQGNFTKVVKNITREVVIQKNAIIVL